MNVDQILQSRANRKTRLGRPAAIFYETFDQCSKAAEAILENYNSIEFASLIERSIVISTVTAMEVYYRDMLDIIFKYCTPEFLEPKLKNLHQEKYDIADILDIYRHRVHPLELISNSQSFQNIERIEKIFGKFLDRGFWSTVLNQQVRWKDEPEYIVTWTNDDFQGLKSTFSLRHELVHDPARKAFFNEVVYKDIWKSAHMIVGSDVVLSRIITENRDPKFTADE